MKYWPDTFVVGFYNRHFSTSRGNDMTSLKFGIPSCKWLKTEKFTDLSRFSRLPGGFLPHTQHNAEKQLMKDISSATEVIDNRYPISGFKLVDRYFDSALHEAKVLVEDPRGFVIELPFKWVDKILFVPGLRRAILESGEIVGKWFYLWEDKEYTLAPAEDAISNLLTDKMLSRLEDSKLKIRSKNGLKPGTVYDIADKANGLISTSRYVYIGQYPMYNPNLVENCMVDAFDRVKTIHKKMNKIGSTRFTDILKSKAYYFPFPWKQPSTIKIASRLKTESKKNTNVFIKLVDGFRCQMQTCFGIPCGWYCDDLAGVSPDKLEHSICLLAVRDGYKSRGYATDVQLKNIVKESEDQSLKILDSVCYTRKYANDVLKYSDKSEYKTMSIEDLKLGFSKFLEKIDIIVDACKKLLPTECKDDLAFEEWLNLVMHIDLKDKL